MIPVGEQIVVKIPRGKSVGTQDNINWDLGTPIDSVATIVANANTEYQCWYGVHYCVSIGLRQQWVPDYAIVPLNMSEDVSEWE